MFYQCILEFGYLGTTLIYLIFIRIFEMAYYLIKRDDNIALGCIIALWGNILLQGADVYMIGPETYAVVPQVIMGVLMNKYRLYIDNILIM